MGSKSLVSVIIIFLNEQQFLQEAIDSVFSQTYEQWELLLVDDGSTDKSSEIARRFAEEYPDRVYYLEHEGHKNRGMSASRNLGIHNAKGKYISFLDGDDVWLPNKLKEQVAILEQHPKADLVHAPLQMWFSWTGKPEDLKRDNFYGGNHPFSNTLVEPPNLLALFLKHEEYIPSGFLIKADVMKQQGTFEEEFHDAYSDAVAMVKVCLTSPVFVSGKHWYKYRKHPRSNTHLSRLHGKEDEEQFLYLQWVENYFNKQRIEDPNLMRILKQMQWPHRHPGTYRLKMKMLKIMKRFAKLFKY